MYKMMCVALLFSATKLLGLGQVTNLDQDLKISQQGNVVLTGGVFDIITPGQVTFLDKARQKGDFLVVALESDATVKEKKGHMPLFSQAERAETLRHLNGVDLVILLPDHPDYMKLVQKVGPKVIVGPEGDPKLAEKQEQANAVGAKVVLLPVIPGYSHAEIKEKLSRKICGSNSQ